MDKAPDAFRTISEVADEIDVPQHVLRFWESRFTQIKPMKRGGGRRYYRPDDVDLLRGVRHLLYGEGYTIRGVQRILRDEGSAFVQNVWRPGAELPPPPDAHDEPESFGDVAETRANRSCRCSRFVAAHRRSGRATRTDDHACASIRGRPLNRAGRPKPRCGSCWTNSSPAAG